MAIQESVKNTEKRNIYVRDRLKQKIRTNEKCRIQISPINQKWRQNDSQWGARVQKSPKLNVSKRDF